MKRNMMNKKGLGIIAAILIMLVVAVMGVTLASLLGTNTQSSINYMQSQQAFFLAESGAQNALLALKNYTTGAAWTGAAWTGVYPAGPMQLAANLTGYGDYIFPTQFTGLFTQGGIGFHVENQLSNSIAVAEVNKGHSAQIAGTLHPATKSNFLVDFVDC